MITQYNTYTNTNTDTKTNANTNNKSKSKSNTNANTNTSTNTNTNTNTNIGASFIANINTYTNNNNTPSKSSPTSAIHTTTSSHTSKKPLNLGLHSGAASGNLGLVKFALDNGQAIDSAFNGVLPIHAACCSNANVPVVLFLIDHGADVNVRRYPRKYSGDRVGQAVGTTGCTPLHFAAANGCLSIVEILLRHGAVPDLADKASDMSSFLLKQKQTNKKKLFILLINPASLLRSITTVWLNTLFCCYGKRPPRSRQFTPSTCVYATGYPSNDPRG
ncbi:ankyrin repeat-containing domain protein [Lobosporangium transversale]|uniref:protein S-acyltransferase n=1 Tax=Lobosporangium transversale TaxID=64571 RepID=A0A1Y2G4X0_9FUNG|nr:ankyrin repeat-containing domain protein [Lobosporangium transversale]ORY93653.1 ankyrin repeat-containing domain protein [Lobosporangium transversale]|eukprot:XP_021875148.1 ankyrin repeat-containing domain protein [Lobosporangium transversale]